MGPCCSKKVRCVQPALVRAVQKKDQELVQRLLADQATDVNKACSCGMTALLMALATANKDRGAMARLLIEKGADVNAVGPSVVLVRETPHTTNPSGDTALTYAAVALVGEDSVAMARLLIEKGADVNAVDTNGDTALAYAVRFNKVELVLELLSTANIDVNKGNIPPLTASAMKGSVAIARLLIEKGADVNAVDTNGDTALAYAVLANKVELVLELLSAANIDVNKGELPPLSAMAIKGRPEMLRVLLEPPSKSCTLLSSAAAPAPISSADAPPGAAAGKRTDCTQLTLNLLSPALAPRAVPTALAHAAVPPVLNCCLATIAGSCSKVPKADKPSATAPPPVSALPACAVDGLRGACVGRHV